MKKIVKAGEFKAHCLQIMDFVNSTGKEVVITKRHIPIAKLCPIDKKKSSLFGSMKGTIHIKGDIISPIDETWDADS